MFWKTIVDFWHISPLIVILAIPGAWTTVEWLAKALTSKLALRWYVVALRFTAGKCFTVARYIEENPLVEAL